MPSRLHPLALPQQSFCTPAQNDFITEGERSVNSGEGDLRELKGHDGVVVSRGQPVGICCGKGHGEEGG